MPDDLRLELMPWQEIVLLSLANAALAFTVTETKLFGPLRAWIKSRNHRVGELVACGYCLGHWTALAFVVIYRLCLFHAWPPLDYFLTALVVAWLSAFQWITLCWMMDKVGK